jgi:hypothetical protein
MVFAIIHQIRVSISAVESSTGVMINRAEVEQAIGFISGFAEDERKPLVQDKVNEAVTHAFECAPRRTLRLVTQLDSAFPGLGLAVRIPNLRLEQKPPA